MKKSLLLFLLAALIMSFHLPKTDSKFEAFKNDFIEAWWKLYPNSASMQGYHKYDSILTIPDNTFRNNELSFCKEWQQKLQAYSLKSLAVNDQTDYLMIENALESAVWYNQIF